MRADVAADDDRASRAAALDALDAQPHVAVVDEYVVPGWSTVPSTAGLTGRSPSRTASSPAMTTVSPFARARRGRELADAELRPLQVGDQRDRPAASASASRTSRARSAWSSCVPCEMLSRAPSMPASISSAITSGRRRRGADRGDDLRARA